MNTRRALIGGAAAVVLTLTGACSSGGGATGTGGTGSATPTTQSSGSTQADGQPSASGPAPTPSTKYNIPDQYKNGIIVAVQTSQAPKSYTDAAGNLVGEEPSMMAAISKEIGVPIKLQGTTFENMILGLQQNKYDFITSTNITADRESKFDQISEFKDGYTLATLGSSKDIGTTLDDLCGLTLVEQPGDAAIKFLETQSGACTSSGKAAIKILQIPELPANFLAVQSGRADAVVATASALGYFIKTNAGTQWKITGPRFLEFLTGLSFPKGSPLVPIIKAALDELLSNGTYKQVLDNNGLSEIATDSIQVNPAPLVS